MANMWNHDDDDDAGQQMMVAVKENCYTKRE